MAVEVPALVMLSPFAPVNVCLALTVSSRWVGSGNVCEVTTPVRAELLRLGWVGVPTRAFLKQKGGQGMGWIAAPT
jgi:hypothetical protein